ncbi:diguanylate cyclase (GGDEF)-like protein [Motilibacter peucedani]|uniref:Diguanylate cyclase (GGDEF)-like protein n=1 Tax=Motilibacter peucedani TaxID=598650 RepID=A0A420XV05_9ACTN|nr:GGDEF domain-containing phosphodiesterase [Motilibacter peucedani]RKS80489.1 diguanylate cyclase (GGDEF)-like protein [Motilibacter peucedani]
MRTAASRAEVLATVATRVMGAAGLDEVAAVVADAAAQLVGEASAAVLLDPTSSVCEHVGLGHPDATARQALDASAKRLRGGSATLVGTLTALRYEPVVRRVAAPYLPTAPLVALWGTEGRAHQLGLQVPSRDGSRCVLLCARPAGAEPYDDDDEAALLALAEAVTLPLENARLLEAATREAAERAAAEQRLAEAYARERVLSGLADRLVELQREAPDMEVVARAVAEASRDITGQASFVLLRDVATGAVGASAYAPPGRGAATRPGRLWSADHVPPVLARALETGDLISTDEPLGPLERAAAEAEGSASTRQHMVVARIMFDGLVRGTLSFHRNAAQAAFTEADLELARFLAARVSLHVVNCQLALAGREAAALQREAEEARAEVARRAGEVLDALPVLVLTLDEHGVVDLTNRALMDSSAATPRFLELLDHHQGRYAAAMRSVGEATANAGLVDLADGIEAVLRGRLGRYEADTHARPAGTDEHWWHSIVVPRSGGGVIITYDDVTDRKNAEVEAAHQATHDTLTGLPNRALLTDRLEHAVARAARHPGVLAVLFIDLDHFKLANDTYGHGFGDALLVQVVARLSAAIRPEDTLARFGGDEFVLLCEELHSADEASVIAGRLLRALEEPVLVEGRTLRQSASLGLAVAGPGTDSSTLLSEADAALFLAKERGRGQLATFDRSHGDTSGRRLDLMQALHAALAGDVLELHFQPIVSLRTGEVTGAEALLRWRRDGVLVGPGEFLHVAESMGLTLPIGRWVLRAACAQAARWRRAGATGRVFVNVSPAHLALGLEDDVRALLEEFGLPGSALGVEITETTLMQDPETSISCLHTLRDLGVSAEIDDFGTGYSSLAYLKELEPQSLKIDRTFVAGVHRDERDRRIVQAIISLARSLGVSSTAEGIESPEQLATLRELGCDAAQGYLLRRPAPPEGSWPTVTAGLLDG